MDYVRLPMSANVTLATWVTTVVQKPCVLITVHIMAHVLEMISACVMLDMVEAVAT
jgi:hypothetical protein